MSFRRTSSSRSASSLQNVLEAVVSQQLVPMIGGKGRVAAFEVLHTNSAVRKSDTGGKTHQINVSVMQTNRKVGMMTMDDALCQLYKRIQD